MADHETSRADRRLAAIRAALEETDTDLIALGPGTHMHWALGFHTHGDERPCFLLVSRTGACFLMPALNAEGARDHTDLPFFEWADADGPEAALAHALDSLGCSEAQSVALDETMRADFALLLLGLLPEAAHRFTHDTVGALRMRKDAEEWAALKENAAIADAAMQAAWVAMKPGMTEREVGAVVRESFAGRGAATLFCIVGAGRNGAFPHHATGDTVLEEGDAVVMDIGGKRGEMSSDITRMAVIGRPPEGYEAVHAVVEAAVEAALAAAKVGAKAHEIDDAARGVITEAGYGEYFVHRTGHGLGLDVHEEPYLTSVSQTVLDEGMVFSIEPGIYIPDRFGIRLEEIVYLTADGPEILSSLPRTLKVVESR